MKKIMLGFAMFGMVSATLANQYESVSGSLTNAAVIGIKSPVAVNGGGANVIYSNGPLINSVGTGVNGEDESILQNNTLGLNMLGSGHQLSADNRVADDFEVIGESWDIESIDFYAYQTGEIASTITAVNLRIWDGVPGDPGSNVVFGDDSTNMMTSTGFSGALRVTESSTGTTNDRQIAVSNVAVGITLSPGTYWLDWQSDGSGASGPWAPPITITGQAATGNALQSIDAGVTYQAVEDSGTTDPQGFPFVIYGPLPTPSVIPTLSFYGLLLLALMALVFGRQFLRQ